MIWHGALRRRTEFQTTIPDARVAGHGRLEADGVTLQDFVASARRESKAAFAPSGSNAGEAQESLLRLLLRYAF